MLMYNVASITATTQYTASSHFLTVHGNIDLVASTTYVVTMQDSYGDGWAWGSFVGGLTIGSASGTVLSGSSASFSFHAAPAPGALALLGLAGIAGTRRRK